MENRLLKAVEFATVAHGDQKRKYTFEPYMVHPLRVAMRAWERGIGIDAVIGAILHDVVEDTNVSLVDIEITFGPTVAAVVSGLTEASLGLKGQPEWNRQARKELDRQKLAEEPPVVQELKLLDLIDNMATVPVSDGFLWVFIKEAKALADTVNETSPGLHSLVLELRLLMDAKEDEYQEWKSDSGE